MSLQGDSANFNGVATVILNFGVNMAKRACLFEPGEITQFRKALNVNQAHFLVPLEVTGLNSAPNAVPPGPLM